MQSNNLYNITITMTKANFWYRIYDLYADGFKLMTLGRTLWTIIIVKLVIIFAVLKFFFFPDFISTHRGESPASDFVGRQILKR